MTHDWAYRQRQTGKLVRLIAAYIFNSPVVESEQLYGLCKLTWITKSRDGHSTKYIKSTKIPALSRALLNDYSGLHLTDIAESIATTLGAPEARGLVLTDTGFTNFYPAYRNSCRVWIDHHRKHVETLFRRAYTLSSDSDGRELMDIIETLPHIEAVNKERSMKPQYLLTPPIFSLDKRMRFPLLNGNKGVESALRGLGVLRSPIGEQYQALIDLYSRCGVKDAVDLDRKATNGQLHWSPRMKPLENKTTKGRPLPLKDEDDVRTLQQARNSRQRRLHNKLTNALKKRLEPPFTLKEGDNGALFDVLVPQYNAAGDDLIVEAKSSVEAGHIRMAVGQLYDYWFREKGAIKPHLAILTPDKPQVEAIAMLEWLGIGVLWIEDGQLHTCTDSLKELCYRAAK